MTQFSPEHKASWVSPKARLMPSAMGGNGLFAIADIPKGETVVVWNGIYVNKAQAERALREGKLVMQGKGYTRQREARSQSH